MDRGDQGQAGPPPPRTVRKTQRPSRSERVERGRAARRTAPRAAHGSWQPEPDRPDPVALLEQQAASRVPDLVPIRYGRMLVSPFTFYRGAALIMASDLAATPDAGITVQCCGDAHLSNFGVFGSPERRLIFDINDFDETLPGPWEWDVKRLAASFEIAGRDRGYSPSDRRLVVMAAVREYRQGMRQAAQQSTLDVWYSHMEIEEMLGWIRTEDQDRRLGKKAGAVLDVAKARTRDNLRAFRRLTEQVDGDLRFVSDPPLLVPVEELLLSDEARHRTERSIRKLIRKYRKTLADEHHPLEEYRYLHTARKVVGVGSVGTRAWVILMMGVDKKDPLILQAKEAQPSVLEQFAGRSAYGHEGQRVVVGQRLLQTASDIFLGWQRVMDIDGRRRDYYIRQLHDWKGSAHVDTLQVSGALTYARMCGATLARAHARSGDWIAIAAYLGKGERFDRAVADFSSAYADQNERDYEALVRAVRTGRISAQTGL
ncbi:MAG: DUF2252 domain-containing protein [Acidimicrobiales bacterium]